MTSQNQRILVGTCTRLHVVAVVVFYVCRGNDIRGSGIIGGGIGGSICRRLVKDVTLTGDQTMLTVTEQGKLWLD
jgi:hypothetical protein